MQILHNACLQSENVEFAIEKSKVMQVNECYNEEMSNVNSL